MTIFVRRSIFDYIYAKRAEREKGIYQKQPDYLKMTATNYYSVGRR